MERHEEDVTVSEHGEHGQRRGSSADHADHADHAEAPRLREALEERSGPLPTGGRTVQVAEGYAMHPWADLRPAGEGTPTGRKLWHSSPGSAG